MTTAPIVFLDTETTGVHPGRKVWEIGMIRRDAKGIERHAQFFVRVDLEHADPFGLKVGGFYERHPMGQYLSGNGSLLPGPVYVDQGASRLLAAQPRYAYLDERDAAHEVARWTHGAHIVGAVPNFDTEVLGTLLREFGLTPAWHYHLIDIEALAVGYLAGRLSMSKEGEFRPTLPWDSDALTAALGLAPVPEAERHTAFGDALWAARIYDAVMGASPSSAGLESTP